MTVKTGLLVGVGGQVFCPPVLLASSSRSVFPMDLLPGVRRRCPLTADHRGGANEGPRPVMPDEVVAAGGASAPSAPSVASVTLREAEFRAWEALGRLLGPREVWEGTLQEIGDEAGYVERTVGTAVRSLQRRGLVSVTARGKRRFYRLVALSPAGEEWLVRRWADVRAAAPAASEGGPGRGETGREVVRSARGAGVAQAAIDEVVRSLRAGVGVPNEGGSRRIMEEDQGGSGGVVVPNPSMSSSSSASADPPSSSTVLLGASAGGAELPAGWESVVAALTARCPQVDPTPALVGLLASHEPAVWQAALERAEPYGPTAPSYIEQVLETTVRILTAERRRLEAAGSDLAPSVEGPKSEPVAAAPGVAVTVRPMAGQQVGAIEVVLAAVVALVRSAARWLSGGVR